ncbi:hypothetical protein MtrunA17_Chr3g0135171 [Medicago truncatula]|nr:hypothetical protein MtrunA17_Chr3g0135171 [Medicago truncatula]
MVVECGDSCSDTNIVHTPVGKSSMKRSSGNIDSSTNGNGEVGQASVTQPSKMVRVKVESKD